jgi:ABC-type transport system involved in multi-copper enzyme maturation permease subunit
MSAGDGNSKGRFLRRSNVWPVVQRELREASRRKANRRLRLLSAGVGTFLLWLIVAHVPLPTARLGSYLLSSLHSLLLWLILLVVPGLTADCIAREKREGTLGLLFLTPLSAGGIVAGKALAQALRAFTLWLAVLPILTIPFMTGGVTLSMALRTLSLEFSATVLCLAAGLLASSMVKDRNTAFLWAFALAVFFLVAFANFFLAVFFIGSPGSAGNQQGLSLSWNLGFAGILSGSTFVDVGTIRLFPGLNELLKWLCLPGPPFALLVFFLVARYAAWRIARSWQDKVPSLRRESLLRRYCTPLLRRRFRRRMQRTLNWNPVAWLQQYSWKARLSKWGLCLLFLVIEGVTYNPRDPGYSDLFQMPLLLTLGGIYSFLGVSGFLEEKRSGALELLLITPISVEKLIFGRVWGLWKQFTPAALVLGLFACCDILATSGGDDVFDRLGVASTLVCCFLTLPIFATYFALRVKNLVVAAILTWIALGPPAMLATETTFLLTENDQPAPAIVFLCYGAFALLTCFLLRHSLSRRIYSF